MQGRNIDFVEKFGAVVVKTNQDISYSEFLRSVQSFGAVHSRGWGLSRNKGRSFDPWQVVKRQGFRPREDWQGLFENIQTKDWSNAKRLKI